MLGVSISNSNFNNLLINVSVLTGYIYSQFTQFLGPNENTVFVLLGILLGHRFHMRVAKENS